jgi:hypothetical protein
LLLFIRLLTESILNFALSVHISAYENELSLFGFFTP